MKETKKWINLTIFFASFYLLLSGNRGLWNLYKLHQEEKKLSTQVFILKNQIDYNQKEYQSFSKSSLVLENKLEKN